MHSRFLLGVFFLAAAVSPMHGAPIYRFTLEDWVVEPASLQVSFEAEDLDSSQSIDLESGELLSFSASYTDVFGIIDWDLPDLTDFSYSLDPSLESSVYLIQAISRDDYFLALFGVVSLAGFGLIGDNLQDVLLNLSEEPLTPVPEPALLGLFGILFPLISAHRGFTGRLRRDRS
jgi:hypothetical protein